MRRRAPLRHYAYVLGTIWLIIAAMFGLWALIADGPSLYVIVPVVAVATIAGAVTVSSQRY
jgi:hypothetical protein